MNHQSTANSAGAYAGELIMPANPPLSAQIQENLTSANVVRNMANELRGRLFGYGPPTPVNTTEKEPHTTADVVALTAAALNEAHSLLSEIHSRF